MFSRSLSSGLLRRAGKTVACWAVGAALVSGAADAATQGTLGATSQGSVTITASVLNRAQITGLTDLSFANTDPTNAATMSENDCVWSNTATKGYSITATGSGTSGAFTLANGSLSVPYSVSWAATSGASSGTALTSGTASGSLTSTATKPACTAAPTTTSTLFVSIGASDLQSMVAATTYTGTLTLLVTPQ